MRRLFVAVAICVCAAAVSAQRGVGAPPPGSLGRPTQPPQQPRPQQPTQSIPQFRASVDLVHLDVSVLDNRRRPVRGLGPADFTVLENGIVQNVVVFSAVDIPDPEPVTAPWIREVAPDVRTNDDLQERRLFLMILDDATAEGDPLVAKNVRDIARKIIDQFGPSDLAAVIFTVNNRNSQDFTSDRSRLLAAVDKFGLGFRGMGGDDSLYFSYSVNVMQRAVEVLSNLPDRRKAILYIGQGAPVDLELAASVQAVGLPTDGGASGIARQGLSSRLMQQMSDAFRTATRANVNIYSFDACGLRVPPMGSPRPTCLPGLEVDYLFNISGATGGRAVVNTSNFDTGIAEVFAENASYYMLGYHSANAAADGKLRRLEVRVNQPGLQVRTRSGYQADNSNAVKRKAELTKSPLGAALSGVIPKSDLPMQLTAVPIAVPGKKEAAVAVILGVRQPIRQTGARTIENVDMQVSAFNVEGKLFATKAMRADVTVRAGASGLAEYEVLSRIDLKPGRYQLRIAANVGSLLTSGSLYYDIDVPNFEDAAVSMSGLVVSATPTPPVAPKDALVAVLPVTPTTRREFLAGDRASAFLRLYQGGKKPLASVPLRVQLRDKDDVLIMNRLQDIAATSFNGYRSADINVELPIGRLAPGRYLLTLESTVGKTTAKRDVRFTVK